MLDCQHGTEYYKQRKPTGKRTQLQGTRKMGCSAHIVCRQYILYPDYRVSKKEIFGSKRKERGVKEETLKQLQRDLTITPQNVRTEVKYHVSLPTEEAHHKTHPTRGSHVMAQRVNPQVAQQIRELVQVGMTNPHEVRKALNHYVQTVLCTENPPNPDDRAYFPTHRDLKNHIYKAKRALELSKYDQHNLAKKISQWKKSYPESQHFFRPYISVPTKTQLKPEQDDGDANSKDEFEQTLMWVHQTKWQQDMLSKYGNTMTLIDATYKTTLYDLALFFITVRTNAGYVVAAEFIIQTETSEQIKEALKVLKAWNPNWSPTYFMCDYSEAEILAIELAFPGSHVYLCDFHHEQSWERWVKDHKHGLTKDDGDSLLDLLRNCANAPPPPIHEEKQEDFYYQQAVSNLKASKVWKDNTNVQGWLTNTWLSIPQVSIVYVLLQHTVRVTQYRMLYLHFFTTQRWARAFRDSKFHECINTNNGTEALNKALKYSYMPRSKHSMNLSSIVSLLVENFLPALRQKYLFSNFEQSNFNRKYKDCVPPYLQDRPREVILHCLDRKASSVHFTSNDINVVDNENGVFEVSNTNGHSYTVKFTVPSCTCPDWTEHNYSCKHFFAIFHHHPTWDWNTLPQAYLC